MTEETIDAAILLLRARALESYGIIKDIYARDAQQGDVELLAQRALQVANLEAGMLTLQQYKADIIEAANKKRATDLAALEPATESDDPAAQDIVALRSTQAVQVREVDES